jgi:hypothetical protein
MNEKSEVKMIRLESVKRQDRSIIKACHTKRRAVLFTRGFSVASLNPRLTVEQTQTCELKSVALRLGWPLEKIKYIEVPSSAARTSNEGEDAFELMLAQITKRRVGAVICSDISRITRDTRTIQRLFSLCALNHTLIISGGEIYDPSNPVDQLLLAIRPLCSSKVMTWEQYLRMQKRLYNNRRGSKEAGQD